LGSNLSKVDYLICSGFPYKIPVQILETASVIAINCHGGPLPSYRGGSPVMWQIINNEKFIGLTIHELTSEFDQGDILMERSLPNISYLDIREVQLLVSLILIPKNHKVSKMQDIGIKEMNLMA
jgi:methionyl-tRNA formyltransferase